MLKLAMLSTGEEVLYGDIVDTNASWASETLFEQGFAMTKRSTVGDHLSSLVEELHMLSFNSDVVIVNGGLGPTSDDLSAEAAAIAADEPLVIFEEWVEALQAFFAARGKGMPESNIKQATLPENAVVIPNPIGTACGFKMRLNECWLYFTPGVPREFKRMLTEQIIPDLKANFPEAQARTCRRLYTLGSSESALSDVLDKVTLPDGYTLGYRSYVPYIEVKIFAPQDDVKIEATVNLVHQLIKDHVVGIDRPLNESVGFWLETKKQTLAISEQGSRGELTHWLHQADMASSWLGHSWVLNQNTSVGDANNDRLAAAFALAGATKEKCLSDLAVVVGELQNEQYSIAISTPDGEWGQTLEFINTHYATATKRLWMATIAGDMIRRYLSGEPVFVDYAPMRKIKDMHIPSSMLN